MIILKSNKKIELINSIDELKKEFSERVEDLVAAAKKAIEEGNAIIIGPPIYVGVFNCDYYKGKLSAQLNNPLVEKLWNDIRDSFTEMPGVSKVPWSEVNNDLELDND